MTRPRFASFDRVALLFGAAAFGACLLHGEALAQYKYVGPDGRVTYSDQPPPAGTRIVEEKRFGRTNATSSVPLPFALQAATSKYPVTIYTGDKCQPCEEGRAYLRTRGVPFVEKTVTSPEDIALFKQQSPDGTAPILSVGSRKATGFAQTTWSGILDDAGYPQTSVLPANYQNPVPTALSPSTQAASAAVAAQDGARRAAPSAAPVPQAPPPASSTPPGFRF